MKIQNLKKVNISHVALHALFIPCDRIDLIKKVEPGVQDTVKIVTEMLSHDMNDSVIRINDAIEMIGGNPKKMRRNINAAIKVSYDDYDGKYGRPPIIPADQFVYIVAALAIKELGRFSDDLDDFVAMTYLSDFIDIGAIENEYDMSCYMLLMDYFIECLARNEQLSLTNFVKNTASPYATISRLKRFFKKNDWYDQPELLMAMFKIQNVSPTPSTIAHALYRVLVKVREIEEEAAEEYELNKAFDQK